MPAQDSPLQKRVVLPKGFYSALEILDEVARQATGVVWFVSYHSTADATRLWVGLMDPAGQTVRLSIDE